MSIEAMFAQPAIERLQRQLLKIDKLRLPVRSRRDVEGILVRQITRRLDALLPTQPGHGRRTATIALELGRTAGLTNDELHHLKLASYLHDIGQLAIDSPHLHKSLGSEDYAALQSHPRLGAQILEPFAFLKTAAILIAHHHERWDGSGYPYGIRGPYIPFAARILAIADAFDAIVVPNACDPLTQYRVKLRILQVASGTQFDPELVDLLCRQILYRNPPLFTFLSRSSHPNSAP